MPNNISLILLSDLRERLQMAAMLAAVSAVSGSRVTVFVSMNALKYFKRDAPDMAPAEGEFGELLERKKAPLPKDLFRQAAELGGARIHPCSMACDVLEVKEGDLEPYICEPMGLTGFLSDAEGAQVYSF